MDRLEPIRAFPGEEDRDRRRPPLPPGGDRAEGGSEAMRSYLQRRVGGRRTESRSREGGAERGAAFPPAQVCPSAAGNRGGGTDDAGEGEPDVDVDALNDGDLEPIQWTDHFQRQQQMMMADGTELQVFSAGSEDAEVTLLLLHGAGHSAMSFARSASRLSEHVRVVSFDARAHGSSTGREEDLRIERLRDDAVAVATSLQAKKLVLVGHSMGGSVATHAAKHLLDSAQANVVGLIVIDVVEGTAIEILPLMRNWLAKRRPSFASEIDAVRHVLREKYVREVESARVSTSPQLRQDDTGHFVWRTQLELSEPFWFEWFHNLSKLFLSVSVPKLLVLADDESLDRDLTIAQMQGKYQAVVVPNCGHSIHEDDPVQFSDVVLHFARRNRIVTDPEEDSSDPLTSTPSKPPPIPPLA